MGGGLEEVLRVRKIMFDGLNFFDEIGVFLIVRYLEISRGRERFGRVIKEIREGGKNK